MMSIDLRNAFDTIDHRSLMAALRSRGLPEAYVDLLTILYTNQSGSAHDSNVFRIQRGVSQKTISVSYYLIVFWILQFKKMGIQTSRRWTTHRSRSTSSDQYTIRRRYIDVYEDSRRAHLHGRCTHI